MCGALLTWFPTAITVSDARLTTLLLQGVAAPIIAFAINELVAAVCVTPTLASIVVYKTALAMTIARMALVALIQWAIPEFAEVQNAYLSLDVPRPSVESGA